MRPKKDYIMTEKTTNRPKCQVPNCCSPAQNVTSSANPKYRKSKWVREKHGAPDGYVCAQHHVRYLADKNGYGDNVTAFINLSHPYLKHRKDYCENIDGRLGFKCTYTAPSSKQLVESGLHKDFMGWLQVDHKDGNHYNNKIGNLQTLCACCHNIKTFMNKDNLTPGRKTRVKDKSLQLDSSVL